jgi:L-lactate dehydrogenase complex protein LldE
MADGVNVAGIIHQDVHRAESRDRGVEHRVHLRLARNIGGERHRSAARNRLRDFGGARRVHVVHHHRCALGGEALGDGAPDAVSGAGDDDDLIDEAFEFGHDSTPIVLHQLFYTVSFVIQRVSLFVTCIVDQVFPQVGIAMADVLERLGYAVDFPEAQTCCGQPAFNSGYPEEARKVARHFLNVFRDSDYVVVPSGSCTSMIAHHYEDIFRGDANALEETHRMASKTWEFSRFLLEVAKTEDVGAHYDGVVTYHDSCHSLRELKIKSGPRRLLSRVRGLTLREMDAAEECCGFGGTFSVKFPEVSGGMARTKIDSILRTHADTLVSIDSSCLMQLQGALLREGHNIRALHLAEVLASR